MMLGPNYGRPATRRCALEIRGYRAEAGVTRGMGAALAMRSQQEERR
jgi:hypothetical protein